MKTLLEKEWPGTDEIIYRVIGEARERQIEETMKALEDGPERFYRGSVE